jgi:hypothetical protein
MPSTVVVERPKFRFDADTHTYWLGSTRLPGCTSILKECGVIDDRYYTEASRLRGQAVHAACHYLGEGDLDWSSVSPKILGYVHAYERFMVEQNFHPRENEVPKYHKIYLYGVTPDSIGLLGTEEAIVERKTGPMPEWAALQTAAQAMAHDPDNWRRYSRLGLELHEDGTYKLERFISPLDGNVFLSMVAVTNWKWNIKGGSNGNRSGGTRG